uniref:Lipid storage droplet binding protein 1 n=1 Tax=Eurygaster maura TaxID=1191085 RepID=V5NQH1_9HEMI|nr:lipid storage droplet binding protein 1 [Eurygaster maura]
MTEKRRLPRLESLQRISKIPVVETSFNIATGLYGKIKHSNRLMQWGFGTVEDVTNYALDTSLIAMPLLELPLTVVDNIVCKGLDTVQQRVPVINYPPEKIINKTKSYVSENIVQPVLKRADSVKQFSLNGAELAASRIDTALDVADQYVEKYLPDATDVDKNVPENSADSKTVQTIVHVNRLSKKLQRRLTKRTIAEARALRKQGMDTAQILLKLAEMMVKDPKQFSAKMRAIWANLSQDEPENQVPPANLEQLIAMITRETARRFVHLTNFSLATAYKLPGYTAHSIQLIAHETNKLIDQALKTVHLEGIKTYAVKRAQIQLQTLNSTVREVQLIIENLLSKVVTKRDQPMRIPNRSAPQHTLSPVAQSPERTPECKTEVKKEQNVQNKMNVSKQNDNTIVLTNPNENVSRPSHNQQQHSSPKKQRKSKASLASNESSDVNSNNQHIVVNGE